MQFTVFFVAALSFFALTLPAIDAAPIDALIIREPSPVPQATDCGVTGGQSCNVIVESPEDATPCGVAGSQSCNVTEDDTAPCGVAGSQSCNTAPDLESRELTQVELQTEPIALCGVAGSQSCNTVSGRSL